MLIVVNWNQIVHIMYVMFHLSMVDFNVAESTARVSGLQRERFRFYVVCNVRLLMFYFKGCETDSKKINICLHGCHLLSIINCGLHNW